MIVSFPNSIGTNELFPLLTFLLRVYSKFESKNELLNPTKLTDLSSIKSTRGAALPPVG